MRKHLLKIMLFYTVFELLRQGAEGVSNWVRGKTLFFLAGECPGPNAYYWRLFYLSPISDRILFDISKGIRKEQKAGCNVLDRRHGCHYLHPLCCRRISLSCSL